jgi:hypothetical protein
VWVLLHIVIHDNYTTESEIINGFPWKIEKKNCSLPANLKTYPFPAAGDAKAAPGHSGWQFGARTIYEHSKNFSQKGLHFPLQAA